MLKLQNSAFEKSKGNWPKSKLYWDKRRKGANWALIKAQILSITEKNQLSRRLGVYIKESRIKRTHWST